MRKHRVNERGPHDVCILPKLIFKSRIASPLMVSSGGALCIIYSATRALEYRFRI